MVRTPAPVRGSHQCCTSPSGNCRRAALRIWSRASFGSCSRSASVSCKLVAEAEGAARLIEGRARPDAAGKALVGQPVVDHARRTPCPASRPAGCRGSRAIPRRSAARRSSKSFARCVATSALASSAEPASPSSQSSVTSPPAGTSTSRAIAAHGSAPASTLPDSAAPIATAVGSSTVPSRPMNSWRSAVTDWAAWSLARKATRSPKSRL